MPCLSGGGPVCRNANDDSDEGNGEVCTSVSFFEFVTKMRGAKNHDFECPVDANCSVHKNQGTRFME